MTLNKMQLPASVLVDLFKNSMLLADHAVAVDTMEEAAPEIHPSHREEYRVLGSGLKNICLLVTSPDIAFISDHHLVFLTKMLQAVKLTLADVSIVNHHNQPVQIEKLRSQLAPKIIILFGVEPTQIKLPFNSPPFKIQEYDGCTYLYAPSLEELNRETEEGKLLKSKLWVCLRKLFEV